MLLGGLLLAALTWASWGTDPASGEPLTELIVAVALLAWALVGWIGMVAALLLLSRLPGAAGSLATRAFRRTAPAVLRRSLQAALGLTVSISVIATVAAPAAAHHGGLHAHVGKPDSTAALPLPAVADPPTSLDWPQPAAQPEAAQHVTVRPGDSLWRLAAERLPEGAPAARIAQTWPTWWAANRGVIGADPDLLHPGTRLTAPPTP